MENKKRKSEKKTRLQRVRLKRKKDQIAACLDSPGNK